MARGFILTFIFATVVFSQDNYSPSDKYYGDFLQTDGYEKLLSNRIIYPGLFLDTSLKAGGGFHYPSWKNMYGWGEWKTGKHHTGAWIGNTIVDFDNIVGTESGDHKRWMQSDYGGTGAFWFLPAGDRSLQGISLSCCGDRIHRITVFNGQDGIDTDTSLAADFSCAVSGLFKTSPSDRVKVFVFDRRVGKQTTLGKEYPESPLKASLYESFSHDFHSLTLSADYIAKKLTIIGAGVRLETQAWNYRSTSALLCSDSYAGEGAFFVAASRGKRFRHHRHSAHLLIRASSEFAFPCTSNTQVNLAEIIKSARLDTRSILVKIGAPVLLEINLFSWPAAVFARCDPGITVLYETKPAIKRAKALTDFDYLSLGVKGNIGERLDFAIVPLLASASSNFFITALDIRYSIPGN